MNPAPSAFDAALGCHLKHETFHFGDRALTVHSLLDNQQFSDPDGEAEQHGISSSMWPIAGLIWASGYALARHVADMDLDGLRILEVGCGIGLASLVARQRGADISATDRHPLAGALLARNAEANALGPINFDRADWVHPTGPTGGFDLVIASDLLYERQHAAELSGFIDHHAAPDGQVVMMAPQRGERGRFERAMVERGFEGARERAKPTVFEGATYAGMLMTFERAA